MNDIERPKFWSSDHCTPTETTDKQASFKELGSSMNAISLGFVATAILISMFLIMAIFEHLLRLRAPIVSSNNHAHGTMEMGELQTTMQPLGKLKNSHLVVTRCPPEFSVLMPGQLYPTHLAQPAPLPCSREGMYCCYHDHHAFASL